MIQDLSQVMNESHKSSYVKCVSAVAQELNKIFTQTSSDVNCILEHAKSNNVSFQDAERTVTEILSMFEILEKNLHSTRNSFIESWHFWLSNCHSSAAVLEKSSGDENESILVLEDKNDLQIVNEVTYRDSRKKHNANDNVEKFDNDIQVIEKQYNKKVLATNLDEKLNFKCFVRLERFRNENKSQAALEEAFLRLIDLTALEKQSKKRSLSSCDSSSSSQSKKRFTKKRSKRRKVSVSDDSDISSYYESSDTDDRSDEGAEFDHFNAQELDDVEEKAKLRMLLDSDTSSECSWPEDDSNCSTLRRRNSSKSKIREKKTHVRAAWLNDELLNFKLPDDKTREPTTGLASDLSSCSESNKSSKVDSDREVKSALTPASKGRRNIRKVLDDQETAENTRQAVKNEESRLERLHEREKELSTCVEDLILDVDPETKRSLVAVDSGLVKLLKPHQKDGVRFMWNCCFESVEQVKRDKGSGCILAHCMGLGKTLQVITLAHTLLANQSAIGVKTLMIVCPKSTILNWTDEFCMWLQQAKRHKNLKIVQLTQSKSRSQRLEDWQQQGGVLIISYEMFRSLTSSKQSPLRFEKMRKLLMEPGADLVVCDEGHLLKNEKSKLASRMQQLKTQRRIILTGTPLQNNLDEYHCMIQFVKPNLLGTKKEFLNRFGNPIANGQFDNSTPSDVKLMKHRAHVLHRLLEGCVQRRDYAVLMPFLPPKHEYVISVHLSDLQTQLYQRYISEYSSAASHCSLFKNYQEIKRLLAHPKTMQLKASCGSEDCWWRELVKEQDLDDMSKSNKLLLLFALLDVCAKERDKVLVFSQCLLSLDTIEAFLSSAEWQRGRDYFRLDGKVSSQDRSDMCRAFNDPAKPRMRLLLISTRAGGLGINLTGANRVVVFDPSWNPSSDLQSIFRVFRFGQTKPCYVYRFLTAGTMEEKIYNRQVNKLSLSLRVVDEQQVGRHYRDSDLMELYKLEPLPDRAVALARPSDPALAEVLDKCGQLVYNYFEHDSLLENQEEEKLDEEEREQAWLEYQLEKHAQPNEQTTTEQAGQEDGLNVGSD